MDIKIIKESYEQSLAGTYDPELLKSAYVELTGNKQPTSVRLMKREIYSFMNNVYPHMDKTDLAVEPPTNSESTHTEEYGSDMARKEGTEVIKLEYPKAKKKKRVYKRKSKTGNQTTIITKA